MWFHNLGKWKIVRMAPVLLAGAMLLYASLPVMSREALLMPLVTRSLLLDIVHIDGRLVAVGERGHIVYSDDDGASWMQAIVPTRQMLTAVYFISRERGWAVGHDGLVLVTVDAGAHWSIQRDGLAEQSIKNRKLVDSLMHRRMMLKQSLVAAADAKERQRLQYSIGELELDLEDASLALAQPPQTPPLLDVYFSDYLHGVAVGAFNTLLLTEDGGLSWNDAGDYLDNPEEFHLNAVTGDGQGHLWVAGEGGLLARSIDRGSTWTKIPTPYDGSWFGVSRAHQSDTLLAFGLRGNIFRSSDGGTTWHRVEVNTSRSLAGGGFVSDRYAVLVGAVGTVLISNDGGLSFDTRTLKSRLGQSAVCLGEKGLILVGQGGIHHAPALGDGI